MLVENNLFIYIPLVFTIKRRNFGYVCSLKPLPQNFDSNAGFQYGYLNLISLIGNKLIFTLIIRQRKQNHKTVIALVAKLNQNLTSVSNYDIVSPFFLCYLFSLTELDNHSFPALRTVFRWGGGLVFFFSLHQPYYFETKEN